MRKHVYFRYNEDIFLKSNVLIVVILLYHCINLLTPNVNYSGRTAPLTSKVAFHIFIQQI